MLVPTSPQKPRSAIRVHPRITLLAVVVLLAAVVASSAAKGLLFGSANPIKSDPQPPLFPTPATAPIGRLLDREHQLGAAQAQRFLAAHPRADEASFLRFVAAQIPPPPAGAPERAELAQLHRIAATRTPAGFRAAQWLGFHGKKDVWKLYAKQYGQFVGGRADAGKKLVKQALKLANVAEGQIRVRFNRPSPYIADPSLHAIQNESKGKLKASYPSKHTALAYAALTVLDGLAPQRVGDFAWMAHEVAYSRLYAGVHYASDLAAGARLGTLIGEYELMRSRAG